jgi:hypothetical protein
VTLLPCSPCCPCPTITGEDGIPYPTTIDVDITCTGWGGDAWFTAGYNGTCPFQPNTWETGALRSAPSSGVYSLTEFSQRKWGYFSRFISISVDILAAFQIAPLLQTNLCIELARISVGVNGLQSGARGSTSPFINCNNPPAPAAYTKTELESLPVQYETVLSIVTYCRQRVLVPGQSECQALPDHTTYASYGNRPSDSINGQSQSSPLPSPCIPATWQTSRSGLSEWWAGYTSPPYNSAGPNGQVAASAATLVINSVVAHYSDGVDRNVFDI